MTGKKRRKYNTSLTTKRQDDVEFSSHEFAGEENVDGVDFLLLGGGGRIHKKYKDMYLYVRTSRVPDDWVKAFEDCQLLSEAKIEQVKHTTH